MVTVALVLVVGGDCVCSKSGVGGNGCKSGGDSGVDGGGSAGGSHSDGGSAVLLSMAMVVIAVSMVCAW